MSISRINTLYAEGRYEEATQGYVSCLIQAPALHRSIQPSLQRALQRYLKERQEKVSQNPGSIRVGVSGWEMSHNAAGRVHTLAQLYHGLAQVRMLGILLSAGRDVWEPIQYNTVPTDLLKVADPCQFLDLALPYVVNHPLDVVHLSKPRAPNLLIGLLYKLIWRAHVVMDVDDEELGFVGAKTSVSIDTYLESHHALPPLMELHLGDWTRIAVGLVNAFDAVTVANRPLQSRYGGLVIAHARDELTFTPSAAFSESSRMRYGIGGERKVVLFLGTPRPHKGLIEVAEAISALADPRILFVIVGDFPSPSLKIKLQQIRPVDYLFIGNQPFSEVPGIVSLADICVLFQDTASTISQFQSPAKLTDALAMGIPVLATTTPPLQEAIAKGAVLTVDQTNLAETIRMVLNSKEITRQLSLGARHFFECYLSIRVNRLCLRTVLEQATALMPKRSDTDPSLYRLALALEHPVVNSLVGATTATEWSSNQ